MNPRAVLLFVAFGCADPSGVGDTGSPAPTVSKAGVYSTQGYASIRYVGTTTTVIAACLHRDDLLISGACYAGDEAEISLVEAGAFDMTTSGPDPAFWRCSYRNVGWTGGDLNILARAHCIGAR
jgi:hypothetical protein